MLTFDTLLKSLGEKASEEIENKIFDLNILRSASLDNWNKIYSKYYVNSILDEKRQVEILKQLVIDMPELREIKKEAIDKIKNKKADSLDKAAWWAIDVADSPLGYRMTLGLKNSGCKYWQNSKDNIGCLNCGYFISTCFHKDIKPLHLLNQFEGVLSESRKLHFEYDVIEFLNDGSFLNDEEVTHESRQLIFKRIAEEALVIKITIETRPEYVSEQKIEALLELLRFDQNIEIALGLETCDPFVQTYVINKGYNLTDFCDALANISKLNDKYQNRISVFSYALVKPCYLTEKEAISDVVNTGKILSEISKKYPFLVAIKLESVVIAEGTLLEIISNNKYKDESHCYKILSYWSIIEIIALMFKENCSIKVRIATREDMDSFQDFPGLFYQNNMISSFDFIVTNAAQRYVKNQNISQLLLDIESALKDKSFSDWKEMNGIEQPEFISLFQKNKHKIEELKNDPEYYERLGFERKIQQVIDIIQYGSDFQQKASLWAKELTKSIAIIREEVGKVFKSKIPELEIDVIDNIKIISNNLGILRMQIKINCNAFYFCIWLGIPTLKRVVLNDMI